MPETKQSSENGEPELSLKEKTARGFLWGGIGSGMQQLLSVVFGIILARMLIQSEYAMVAVLQVFMNIAFTIQEGGFTAGLVNRKQVRHEDYNAVFWFNLGTSACMYAILFVAAPWIADFFNDRALVPLSRFLFLWFLFGSMGGAHYALLVKELRVKERMKIDVLSLAASILVGIVFLLKGYGYWAFAIQLVTHSFMGNALRWYYCKWRPDFHISLQPLKEMFPFSIKLVLTGFVSQINANILTVLSGRFYNMHDVGVYSQGNKWAGMGSSFINTSLQGVVQPVLVQANDDSVRQRNVFRKMLRFVAFVSFPAMFGLAFVAEDLIVVLITDKWLTSISFLQLFCIWGAFLPVNTIYTQLLISNGKSGIYLWVNTILGMLQIAALLLTKSYGIFAMAQVFVAINFLTLFIWHCFANRLIAIRLSDALKDIVPYLLITFVVMVVCYFITLPISNIYARLAAKILSFALLYTFIMWKANSVIFREAVDYLLKKKR